MRKIVSALVLVVLAWFSNSALAYSACDPNSPAVPCTYNGKDFDTVMYNNNIKMFYQVTSYVVDRYFNGDPDVNDVWDPTFSSCTKSVAWVYGTYYDNLCHVGINNTAAAGFGWLGRGANVWQYFSFPRADYTAYDTYITSVMDSDTAGTSTPYGSNSSVTAFNGEVGNVGPYSGSTCYRKSNSASFLSGSATYTGTSGSGGDIYLCYDGHPGYDYATSQGGTTAIYAPADGTLCVAHSVTSQPSPSAVWRDTTKCPLDAAPGTSGFGTPVNWTNYHVFYILHGSMLVNGSTDEYMTVFLHNNNLETGVLGSVYANGYKTVTRMQHVADAGGQGPNGASDFPTHVHVEFYKKVSGVWNRVDPYGNGTNNILWLKP